jgi:hypothetical protein
MAPTPLLHIPDAQRDMRFGYYGGAPGVLASAIAWLAAGLVAGFHSPKTAVLVLFGGGMLIHPVGVLIAKLLGRPGAHTKGNPLGALALEGTIFMLLCLPLAYAVSVHRIEWFFPAMLLVIGGRYLTFATLYGWRIFRVLGGALALMAFALVILRMPPAVAALAGGAAELVFAAVLFTRMVKASAGSPRGA